MAYMDADSTGEGHVKRVLTQEEYLCEFSQKVVDLLVEEAARALQAPGHGGLDLAACLLQDALKYDALYCRARAVPDEQLFEAAQKLGKWNIVQNANR